MITLETIEQATAVLQDEDASEKDRVAAAHYLGKNGSAADADVLVTALEDDDFGVHWAASEGLAQLGDAALPALLKALGKSDCTTRVFEGAKHTLHTSSGHLTRTETKKLLQAMHGSTPDVGTIEAAYELMNKLAIS